MTTRFRDLLPNIGPSWLTTGEGRDVLGSLLVMLDIYAERARQAVLVRFPSYAPDDALPFLGRDRGILRGFSETRASYEPRLIDWLLDRKTQGNPFTLLKEIRAYCGVDMLARTVDRRGNWFTIAADGTRSYVLNQANWDWDGVPASPDWSRFWVILYPPTSLWTEGPNIGDADLWNNAIGSAGFTIGTTATPEQVAAIRSLVRFWKPAGTKCEHIIIALDDSMFAPTHVAPASDAPAGTWGEDWDPATQLFTREQSARYWLGA